MTNRRTEQRDNRPPIGRQQKESMMDRIKRTVQHAAVGGLAGFIAERGLEAATGNEFVNGVIEIAGVTLGVASANRDLVEMAVDGARAVLGKEPSQLTNAEWDEVRARYPKAVAYLEKALAVT